MKVILLCDVKNQGKKDDIIEVSDGYANNFLIKNKLAVMYSPESKRILDKQIQDRKSAEDALVKSLNEIKNKIANKTYKFNVKTGKDGKVFGSVSTKQISEKLLEDGYKIDKKCITLNGSIDTLGTHKVTVTLHKKVVFTINVSLIN